MVIGDETQTFSISVGSPDEVSLGIADLKLKKKEGGSFLYVNNPEQLWDEDIIYADKTIVTVDLVAANTVELSSFLKILNMLKKFFTNKFVIALLVLLLLGCIAYVIWFVYRMKRDKRRIAEKRRQQEELDKTLYGDDDYLPPAKK